MHFQPILFYLVKKQQIRYLLAVACLLVVGISSPFRNAIANLMEEKPISASTLLILERNDDDFSFYAEKYEIPKVALKAAVGSEINRRIGINWLTDYLQDIFFASSLCSEQLLYYSQASGIKIRLLNITEQDIGLGNIKFLTAMEMLDKNKKDFPFLHSKRELVDYLLTTSGNIHIAALVIKEGATCFSPYFAECDELTKSAILYSFYKEGAPYYNRYLKNSQRTRPPFPDPDGLELVKKLSERTL